MGIDGIGKRGGIHVPTPGETSGRGSAGVGKSEGAANAFELGQHPPTQVGAVAAASGSAVLDQVRAGLEAAGMTGLRTDLRLDLIPLGVDADLYRPRNKRDVRSLLGLPQEKTLLLCFGSA